MKKITILGSTGSIGQNTLSVIRENPALFTVLALVAGSNVEQMANQCREFLPRVACMADDVSAQALQKIVKSECLPIEVVSGIDAACQLASLRDADYVMAAIVGAAGLLPTMAAIHAGKRVLLANKESLVTCGRLFMDAVAQSGAQLLPIDSEHNAIFQSLPQSVQHALGTASLSDNGIDSIILTGSGGPFRQTPMDQLATVTPSQACNHPNWSMGRKISVDSATMMNKGLEYIEARWLFNASPSQMEVLIHPQSVIHSMVRYRDGSVIAQMGEPDMRTPIAHAMAYPQRVTSGAKPLDFCQMGSLTFEQPDFERYPCLKLAIEASHVGQAATTALNAANECSVSAFLQNKIRFADITFVNQHVLNCLNSAEPNNIEAVMQIDKWARGCADDFIAKRTD